MKKNKVTFLSILIAATLLLSACANTATTEAPAANPNTDSVNEANTTEQEQVEQVTEPIEISFWHTYTENNPESDTLVNVLIPAFEADHPNIKVNAVSVPYESFRTKLLSALAAGTAPDLIRSDIIWVPELAQMGAFLALDEVMSDFSDYKDIVFPGPLSTNMWNGHYYGLPLDTNTKVWLYNADMYSQAGLESAPTKLEELEADCQAIKAVNPDSYVFAADGMYSWVTLPWIWSFGGSITDDSITTATGYLNSPETVAAYTYILKLYDEGCISPVIMGDGVDVWSGMATGVYASLDNGPWTYAIIGGQFPDFKISSAKFPAGPAGSIDVVGGEDVNLLTQSKHPEEAMEFIRYLMSENYQLTMMEVGQIPVRSDLIESEDVQNHPYLGIFLEQLQTSKARTAHPAWAQMDVIITDAGQYIMRKEKTPQQALDDAAAEIDALLQQ